MNEFETGVCVGILLQKRGGSANLDSVTFTANDTYTPTPPLDGWNEVTVAVPLTERTFTANDDYINSNGGWNIVHINVPTYYDEWQDAIEQLEHMQECCEAVVQTLQKYDPDFDPEDCEDIPPEIDNIVDDASGYTFPDGTDPDDIAPLVGGDAVQDETLGGIAPKAVVGVSQHGTWTISGGYIDAYGEYISLAGWDTGLDAETYPEYKPIITYAKILDKNTGEMEYKAQYWGAGGAGTWTATATASDMIGYGDTSHTYRVRN